jgi:uncharacterized protein
MTGAIGEFARRGLALLPDRAVWAGEARTLWVADLHLGKASAFRNHGQPAPEGSDEETLCRLARLVDRLDARRLIVLGDFMHARSGQTSVLHDLLRRWTAARQQVECLVIRGNHDRGAGDAPDACGFTSVDAPFAASGVEGRHHPIERGGALEDGPIVLAGHLHPVARLSGLGDSVRLACFAIMGRQIVLPAFGEFTGGWLVRPGDDWKILVTTDEHLFEVGAASRPARTAGTNCRTL